MAVLTRNEGLALGYRGFLAFCELIEFDLEPYHAAALLMAYEGATAPLPAPTKVLGWL